MPGSHTREQAFLLVQGGEADLDGGDKVLHKEPIRKVISNNGTFQYRSYGVAWSGTYLLCI